MTVSEILSVISGDEEVIICDASKSLANNRLYKGYVRDLVKDNPIIKYNTREIFACETTLVIYASAG